MSASLRFKEGTSSSLCLLFVFVFCLSGLSLASDHLLVISHDFAAAKRITVYEPGGDKVFDYVTPGHYDENTPTFIASVPSRRRFAVACPNAEDHGHGKIGKVYDDDHHHGIVEVFDYISYPFGPITRVTDLETGDHPFHLDVTPDNLFCVANDGEETFTLIHPNTLDMETIEGGEHHATFAFAGDAASYDIFVTQYHGASEPGKVDIVDSDTRDIRTTIDLVNPLPHTAVYSALTNRVYIACASAVEVIGTQGAERDVHLGTIPTTVGKMTPLLRISRDGRFLYGNLHYDGVEGSYFYSIDLTDPGLNLVTVPSVSCKTYGYSSDGRWIVAGDFNVPSGQAHRVHVICADPESEDYMTVVREWTLTGANASRIAFQGVGFSPDGRTAYVALHTIDRILAIDLEALTYSTFECEAAPNYLHVLDTRRAVQSSVPDWETLR